MQRRLLNVSVILLILPALVAFRLWQIQIQQGENYRLQSLTSSAKSLPAARGGLFTNDRLVLAVDRGVWDLHVVFRHFDKDSEVSLHNLAVILDSLEEKRFKKDLSDQIAFARKKMEKLKVRELAISNKKKLSNYLKRLVEGQSHLLFKNVPAEIWIPLKTRPESFPGFRIKLRTRRVYPQGEFLAHVIGRVRLFNAEDRKKYPYYLDLLLRDKISHFNIVTNPDLQPLVFWPDDYKGASGLEKQMDTKLHGIPGALAQSRVVVNGVRQMKTIEELSVPPTKGWDYDISIDSQLQKACEEVLKTHSAEKGGSVVIINAGSGAVMAMASYPSFKAGFITKKQIYDNVRKPLTNKCLEMQITPASVFKIVSSVAILESGVALPHTTVNCHTGGFTAKGSRTVHCWHVNYGYSGHGAQNISEAIANSCNMYYYNKGSKLGWDRLTHWAKLFGFGQKTGIDLPREFKGQLPPRRGAGSGITNFVIGQGNLQVTPLQVATFMATVANRGERVTPYLVSSPQTKPKKIVAKNSTWNAVQQGMRQTVIAGTAKKYPLLREFKVHGKTGTAEAGKDEFGNKRAAHTWFAGYWKEGGETYAFAVCLINAYKYINVHGEETSAAGAMAEILKKHYRKFGQE
jgi:penicillin-binding protein 2